MNFINELYPTEVEEQLFKGDTAGTRVDFSQFMAFVEASSSHKHTSEEFEKSLAVFDDDQDGTFAYQDIIRVMRDLGECSDADIVKFIQRCEHGYKPPKELASQTLAELEPTLPIKSAKKRQEISKQFFNL